MKDMTITFPFSALQIMLCIYFIVFALVGQPYDCISLSSMLFAELHDDNDHIVDSDADDVDVVDGNADDANVKSVSFIQT